MPKNELFDPGFLFTPSDPFWLGRTVLPQYKTSQTTTDRRRQTAYCTIGSTDSTVGQKWNCKLSRNNVACFKYDFVLFLLYAVTMLDLSMKSAGHDDVVSINRSINFVIDYFINRLIDFN